MNDSTIAVKVEIVKVMLAVRLGRNANAPKPVATPRLAQPKIAAHTTPRKSVKCVPRGQYTSKMLQSVYDEITKATCKQINALRGLIAITSAHFAHGKYFDSTFCISGDGIADAVYEWYPGILGGVLLGPPIVICCWPAEVVATTFCELSLSHTRLFT